MTDRELMQQALELVDAYRDYTEDFRIANKCITLIELLRARLAQPEPDREKLFGVIELDKDEPLTPEDRKKLRLGLMACLLEEGVMAKLGMLMNRYERTIERLEAQPEPSVEPVAGYRWKEGRTPPSVTFADPPQRERAKCDGGTCGLGGYCDECPNTQPEQEPVGEIDSNGLAIIWANKPLNGSKLYTAPPQREWQGLTHEEKMEILTRSITAPSRIDVAEAMLKEKNNG